jgi:hypothetical protein
VTQPTSCLGLSALDRRPARTGIALMGHEWLECLVSIPIIAVVPFTVIICAVRRAAPDQSGSNRFSGVVAGGVSAIDRLLISL